MATTKASLELFLKRLLKRKYESGCKMPRKFTNIKIQLPGAMMRFQGRPSVITEFLWTSVLLLIILLIPLVFSTDYALHPFQIQTRLLHEKPDVPPIYTKPLTQLKVETPSSKYSCPKR
jgi:hypothetical protein